MASSHRRHSALTLLALLVFGWVLAPPLHQIEHALEWAGTEHHHGPEGGFSDGHDLSAASPDDCTLCVTRTVAESGTAEDLVDLSGLGKAWLTSHETSGALTRDRAPIRGPPVAA
ncbi:MAG: hypothetical protein JJ896_11870 [Rhodothermales bacterium]|nr:hypothetical protein [Rhodothermales bacterium]MBO6780342.1 hypothetical protein [Rhodothermales bacterium]